ncbi:hypothetical protein CHL78_017130 [Romboutsia weinsteinii]|uniref:Uncharacterized protein n=1 Tax=Romboutsia weinsteinii TaxID=2020949 RepID=A0A371IYT9_9FIRM|nr:hypothetical protein CHL78_017130 [Romboutsia weinsteinii]
MDVEIADIFIISIVLAFIVLITFDIEALIELITGTELVVIELMALVVVCVIVFITGIVNEDRK